MHLNDNQTMYFQAAPQRPASILIFDKNRIPQFLPLSGSVTFGRNHPGSDRDIWLNSSIVGRIHGEFIYNELDGSYYYIDNNSSNGTYLNGKKLAPYNARGTKAVKLSDGDILRIDGGDLAHPHPDAVLMIFSTTLSSAQKWESYDISQSDHVTIGRDKSSNIVLDDLMASRCHAVLRKADNNKWYIRDNGSTNGVGLNSTELVNESRLHDLDIIRIANTTIIFHSDRIYYNSSSSEKLSLLVDIGEKTVNGGRKTLLKDIRAEFEDGDFVLILGGSGAGKTTLIRAILGESKAEGKIVLNGRDLYKSFKQMKSQIGMVPQFLTLRKNDTVRETLLDTAAIKLGRSYSKAERIERVDKTIEHVGITEHAGKLIGRLSGGQQKKASVANQLVGFQKVFICDEPDSGLDAASRTQQMEILKEISQDNRIVMVITHEPDDAFEFVNGMRKSLFTKVLVLAKSSQDGAGHLAYFGETSGALNFFSVKRLQDIMLKINPGTEGGAGRADYYIEKYQKMTGGQNNG